MKLLDAKGNLKGWVATSIGILGAAFFLLPLYMEWHPYVVISGLLIGMILMGFSAYANHSAVLDLRAFTNDPLGWRKAKATYEDGESLPASKPGFIARLFGRK